MRKLGILVLVCLLFVSVASGINTISNVYEGETSVGPSQSLTISAGGSGGVPRAMSAGQHFYFFLDVWNPNNKSILGMMRVTFTKVNITVGDVLLNSPPSYITNVIYKGIYGSTMVFQLEARNQEASPYFEFRPGINYNATCIIIAFNTIGTYDWNICVIG